MVVDSSVLLAIFFEEPLALWAADRLAEHAGELRMSTVNLKKSPKLVKSRFAPPQTAFHLQ